MAMQPVYLVAVNNLPKFLEALRHAQAPEKLTLRFIEELGFTSTNDRLFVPLLKALKFVDDAGKPTSRYHAFLDDTQWKAVLAAGIRDAYPDLFRVNRQAHNMSREQLAGKIKSLSEGKATPTILKNTVKTFLELVKLADFSAAVARAEEPPQNEQPSEEQSPPPLPPADASSNSRSGDDGRGDGSAGSPALVYRIEIVLPAVRDQAVYDAIFQSAKRHLLS
jgi:hypothetical protein